MLSASSTLFSSLVSRHQNGLWKHRSSPKRILRVKQLVLVSILCYYILSCFSPFLLPFTSSSFFRPASRGSFLFFLMPWQETWASFPPSYRCCLFEFTPGNTSEICNPFFQDKTTTWRNDSRLLKSQICVLPRIHDFGLSGSRSSRFEEYGASDSVRSVK